MALVAIGAMYAAFLLIGWRASRRAAAGSVADFLVAGRSLPLWLATLTMTATWVDGGYLLGTAEGVYKSSLATGLQGGVCFGISLILGGLFFAKRMRVHAFTTLIDPFEARFGPRWAVVLSLPAVMAEMFWSAELLVALGATFGVILDLDLTTAIVMSAVVVTFYTMIGGMWAVAYTDAFQLGLVAFGLAIALPVAMHATGGFGHVLGTYVITRPEGAVFLPPLRASGSLWTSPAIVGWWDLTAMLIFGGIPWNCYFQRVLSCRSPRDAQAHSVLAGLLTILLTFPPLLLGLVAAAYPWSPDLAARLAAQPADALPMVFKYVTPPVRWTHGVGRDHRRRDVEFLLVHPVGELDVQLEHVHEAAAARSSGRDAATGDARHDRRAWRGRRGDGVAGAERSGALVFHQRSRLRPARAAADLCAARSESQPHRLGRRL